MIILLEDSKQVFELTPAQVQSHFDADQEFEANPFSIKDIIVMPTMEEFELFNDIASAKKDSTLAREVINNLEAEGKELETNSTLDFMTIF